MTEQRAIEGCRKQDRKAQKHLFDAYSEAMLMVCIRYVKRLPDAEEMMLNGFFKFYRSIDRFIYSGPGSLGAWLKKIMVNECLMLLRKTATLQIVEEKFAATTSADPMGTDQLGAKEILQLTLRLPVGYRTVFNLFVVEGFSHHEIAVMLDISEGTSKSQLSKARAMLQKMMQQNNVYDGK